jgi:hypothetical protein
MSLKWDLCNGGKNSKKRILILLAYNANGSDKLPPLLIGKNESPCCSKMSENCPQNMKLKEKHGFYTG